MTELTPSKKDVHAHVKLIRSLSDFEASLGSYFGALELLIKSFMHRANVEQTHVSKDDLKPFLRAVGKGLASISECQALLLKKSELLCENYYGNRNTDTELFTFVSTHRPEFERCARSIQRMFANHPRINRRTVQTLKHISRYSTLKSDLQRSLLQGKTTSPPWIAWNLQKTAKHTGKP